MVVEALVRDKFRRNAKAREVLVGTGRVKLVYTNAHDDRVWGVCGGEAELAGRCLLLFAPTAGGVIYCVCCIQSSQPARRMEAPSL